MVGEEQFLMAVRSVVLMGSHLQVGAASELDRSSCGRREDARHCGVLPGPSPSFGN